MPITFTNLNIDPDGATIKLEMAITARDKLFARSLMAMIEATAREADGGTTLVAKLNAAEAEARHLKEMAEISAMRITGLEKQVANLGRCDKERMSTIARMARNVTLETIGMEVSGSMAPRDAARIAIVKFGNWIEKQ